MVGGYLPIGYLPIRGLSWAEVISVYRLESGLKGTFTALERARGNTSGVGTWLVWETQEMYVAGSVDERCVCALRMRNARTARALWKDG